MFKRTQGHHGYYQRVSVEEHIQRLWERLSREELDLQAE